MLSATVTSAYLGTACADRLRLDRQVRGRIVELAIKNAEDDLKTKLGRDFNLPRRRKGA